MTTIHRVLGPSDVEDLIGLRLQWKPAANASDAHDLAVALRGWWGSEGERRVGWLARHTSGTAVGMANAAIFTRMPAPGVPTRRWAYVANVYVDPAHRRQGVGTALMGEVLAWARAEGMVRVVLAPSPMSVPFYRGLGLRAAEDLLRLDL